MPIKRTVTIELPIEVFLSYQQLAKKHGSHPETLLSGILTILATLAHVYMP